MHMCRTIKLVSFNFRAANDSRNPQKYNPLKLYQPYGSRHSSDLIVSLYCTKQYSSNKCSTTDLKKQWFKNEIKETLEATRSTAS